MKRSALSILIAAFLIAGCSNETGEPATEEEAHAHGGGTAVTLWTDSMEVFFEYPPMIAGQAGDPWAIHVTRLADFSPIEEGQLTLAFRGPDGQVYTTTSQAPARPGIYTPAPQLPAPGVYDLILDVDAPRLQDQVGAGEIEVFASEEDLPHAAEEAAGSAIAFLKEQQWPMIFGVARAEEREIPRTINVSGEIVAAPDRLAEVSAPVTGLALAEQNLSAPAPGDRVAAGQTLAVLSPSAEDNTFAQAKARVERLRRDVGRLERLFEAQAIPEKRLVETAHDLEVAEAALEAMGGAADGDYTYTVRSPIDGVLQRRFFVPGQHVDAGEPLFEIVNPSVVWISLQVPARLASAAESSESVSFIPDGTARRYETRRLISVGSSIDPETRALLVLFAAGNPTGELKIGQFVRAQLRIGGTRSGVSVPSSAVMNEDGQSVLYVQVGGESFERRPVTLGASDGEYALVEEGLEVGEYVVTDGAYEVYLASLSTTDIGDHGHPH